jgi:hypothetical protein
MARPKQFHGSNVGVKLPRELDLMLRAAALDSGRTLSDLIRETLAQRWGKARKPQEIRHGETAAK